MYPISKFENHYNTEKIKIKILNKNFLNTKINFFSYRKYGKNMIKSSKLKKEDSNIYGRRIKSFI